MKKIFFMALVLIISSAAFKLSAQKTNISKVEPAYVFTELKKDTTVTYIYPKGEEISRVYNYFDENDNSSYIWKTETSGFRIDVKGVPGAWRFTAMDKPAFDVYFMSGTGRKITVIFKEGD